jgi:hypothetical protein
VFAFRGRMRGAGRGPVYGILKSDFRICAALLMRCGGVYF